MASSHRHRRLHKPRDSRGRHGLFRHRPGVAGPDWGQGRINLARPGFFRSPLEGPDLTLAHHLVRILPIRGPLRRVPPRCRGPPRTSSAVGAVRVRSSVQTSRAPATGKGSQPARHARRSSHRPRPASPGSLIAPPAHSAPNSINARAPERPRGVRWRAAASGAGVRNGIYPRGGPPHRRNATAECHSLEPSRPAPSVPSSRWTSR